MNTTFSSRFLRRSATAASFFTLVACAGKVEIGQDQPQPSSTTSAGGSSGSDSGSNTGTGGAGGGSQTVPNCERAPARSVAYSTLEELDTLLVRRWQRCLAPQLDGEDVGVEFTADGHYYPLAHDSTGAVVRLGGPRYEGTWIYYAPGTPDPISHQPLMEGRMSLNGTITNSPSFTEDPVQMGILFSPVPSRYVPLDP